MPDLTIITASEAHQHIILEILQDTQKWLRAKGINQWTLPFTLDWVNECIQKQQFFVATIDDEIVGTVQLTKTDDSMWGETTKEAFYIHSLAVRRRWQGHQIGGRLLCWIEAFAIQNNRRYLRLDCMAENSTLCQYYEQLGFVSCCIKEILGGDTIYKAQLFEKAIQSHRLNAE